MTTRGNESSGAAGSSAGLPLPASARAAAVVIVLVLVGDAIFIGLDALAGSGTGFPDAMRIARERGIPEIFQYLKWLAAAGLMWSLRAGGPLYRVWTVTFLYLLIDDALSLHERFGSVMSQVAPVDRPLGLDLEPYVLPQLLFQAVSGLALLVALILVGRRTAAPSTLRFSAVGLVLLAIFAAFAVGADFLFDLLTDRTNNRGAQLFEEGAEMVLGTLILGHVLVHVVRLRGLRSSRPA